MSFITEHVICGLRPGADPRVVGSPAAEKMKEACQTLSQQRGFVRQYWVDQIVNILTNPD